MKDLVNIYFNEKLQDGFSYFNEEDNPYHGIENFNIIVHKNKFNKRKKFKLCQYAQQPTIGFRLSSACIAKHQKLAKRHFSLPELKKSVKSVQPRTKSVVAVTNKNGRPFDSKFIVNLVSQQGFQKSTNPFIYPSQTKWKIYRCQLSTAEETCCCSCNSDAMFEVMKSLYDCYKKKNCDTCDCILCGHKHREERRLGELKKSIGALALEATPSAKQRKEQMRKAEKILQGKSLAEKEQILRDMVKAKQPLPEGKTPSEKKLINKVRTELGLPPEPTTPEMKAKYAKAADAGLLQPLKGKTAAEKEKILTGLHNLGIPLPEGQTPSDKAFIVKVKAIPHLLSPSEKKEKAKPVGFLTPLEGKTLAQKENILKGLAMTGKPLPEGKTTSDRKLIDKLRNELGLPPEPKTAAMRDKYAKAADAGLLQPLEGKTHKEKERILQGLHDMGIPLPEGRMPSEKSLIAKVKTRPLLEKLAPSEGMRRAKATGLITPLEGKSPKQKEIILKGLAQSGVPLPEGKTPSKKKLINKVRTELGLPPEPTTPEMKAKYAKAADAGLLQPLEGKTAAEKEKILTGLHHLGIPLPEGQTPSDKALIVKVKARPHLLSPSEKKEKAKPAGFLTPLEGKTLAQKENILKGLAMTGKPLPEGKTTSDRKLIDKVRNELGLPPEPKTAAMRDKYAKAADAGLLQPLEGKTPKEKERILQGLHDMGIPLPEGRMPSEKSLIAKVKTRPLLEKLAPSEGMRRAKATGLITPLEGKTPKQKEIILTGLAQSGVPLPEGKTPSEKKLINKVRTELGLPPEPTTPEMKAKYAKAADAGLLQPLEGKTAAEKEKILTGLQNLGIPMPEGRTPSEKSLITKIKAGPRLPSPSEKKAKAKAAGLVTPLEGKTPAQKEKILIDLAMRGLPLPDGRSASERNMIIKIRADLGLPPAPATPSMRDKHSQAADAGLLLPLERKSPDEKERILTGLHDMGIPLPEGRTPSEKALISQVKARPRAPSILLAPSERVRKAKAAGLLTPLKGKTPEQKEKILKGLAMHGVPLPESKTPSEKKTYDKMRAELGLPPEAKTPDMKEKHAKAAAAGLLQPLEGKSPKEKERILKGLADMGIPPAEGRTPSEKALIYKVKSKAAASVATEKIRKAKAAGLLTPLAGKSPKQKENILKDLAKAGLPLPEGRTSSEKSMINKIKKEYGKSERMPSEKLLKAKAAGLFTPLEGKTPAQAEKILRGRAAAGLPLPEGRRPSERALIQKIKDEIGYVTPSPSERLRKAKAAGLLTPLKGKTPAMKEAILRDMLAVGVPIPEGETPSEKEMIKRLTAGPLPARTPSEKIRQAKAAGLMTPLLGKTQAQKKKILKGFIQARVPLPEPKTASEKDLIDKIREEAGLPPEPKTPSLKEKYRKAQAAGLISPLEGKPPKERERILKRLHDAGIPLPEGRTPSEKSLVRRVKAGLPVLKTPSEKFKTKKAAGLLTPLEGKTPAQKEKILRGLANAGVPLPEAKTPSEKGLIHKIRTEMGLPQEPKTRSLREKLRKTQAGLITPLEGKSPAQKENILKSLAEAGKPLPEGRTPSEKALIAKVKAETKSKKLPSEKIHKAKTAGLLTQLEGKSPEQKEKILRALAERGLPLPEAKTVSEKKLAAKIRTELGLPPEPKTPSMKEKHQKAAAAGVLVPLEGLSPGQKEKVLTAQADLGLPLPEGRTPSEKALIAKVKVETKPKKVSSEEMRKAKAAGLLTPLEGKSPEQKVKIMKGLAEHGLPIPETKTASEEKLRKAKAAGFLTPLEGKTPAEKEKIIRGLAAVGLPLPEGKTASEKSLIHKIKIELGMSLPSKTPSKKTVIRKAKADGLFTPLTGKTPAQQKKILKGLAEAGLPLPVGKTASEKDIIKKFRIEARLPPERASSEKIETIKKKGKKVGITPSKGLAKGIGDVEFKDVIKTTMCDRGCGCDKKKIRFKHSYVKIRVTSPDISSLCDCPEECLPGVKAGAFIDNEGIKVTVGTAVGVSSFSKEFNIIVPEHTENDEITLRSDYNITPRDQHMKTLFHHSYTTDNLSNSIYKVRSFSETYTSSDKVDHIISTTSSDENRSSAPRLQYDQLYNDNDTGNYKRFLYYSKPPYEGRAGESNRFIKTSRHIDSLGDVYRNAISKDYIIMDTSSRGSFDSNLVIKTETSLSFTSSSSEITDTISMMSFADSSVTSNSTHYFDCQLSDDPFSNSSIKESEFSSNRIDYNAAQMISSNSDNLIHESTTYEVRADNKKKGITYPRKQNEYLIYTMSQTKLNGIHKKTDKSNQRPKNGEPIVIISHLNSERDISTMVDELLSKNEFPGASSIFVVVPSDDNDAGNSSDGHNSTICIQMNENYTKWNNAHNLDPGGITQRRNSTISHGVKISAKGKQYFMEWLPTTVLSFHNKETMFDYHHLQKVYKKKEKTKNKLCQITTPNEIVQIDARFIENRYQVVSTDTTADRPCCCPVQLHGQPAIHYANDTYANVMSKQITPLLVKQGLSYDPFELTEMGLEMHSSFMSLDPGLTSVTPCRVPPCSGHGYLALDTRHKKKTIKVPNTQPCQCSPEKLKELLEQAIKAGKTQNMKSIGCGQADKQPEPPALMPTPMLHKAGNCEACLHPTHTDECDCSSKKKTISKPLCPCEVHKPRELKIIEPGLQTGPESSPFPMGPGNKVGPSNVDNLIGQNDLKNLADQIRLRSSGDPRLLPHLKGLRNKTDQMGLKGLAGQAIPMASGRHPGQRQLIGPAGESSQVEKGGTYTQAGTRVTRFSSTIGTNTDCACKDKHGKKKKKIICECPETELVTYPTEADFEWLMVSQEEINKMKSNLTEAVSGFKLDVLKRTSPNPQNDYTLDNAIREYASMKPELFRDLIQDQMAGHEQERPNNYKGRKKERNEGKGDKTNIDCECPSDEPPVENLELSEIQEEGPFRGLKIKMGGKGSGSPGLTGICCFDMLQESFSTW